MCMDCINLYTFTNQNFNQKIGYLLNLTPCVQQVLDLHPNLRDEIVPVGFISATTILTWLVIAVVFRVLHRSQGPALLVCGTKLWGRVAYRTSFLAALERPVMVLITIFALLMMSVELFFLFMFASGHVV